MLSGSIQIAVIMVFYMGIVVCIGLYFAKRAHSATDEFFLGGRSLGPWVAAMSAEASDMSGWLLMGLPGVAYWCGLCDAVWTAVGLAAGTYLNWLLVAKRLRRYSTVCGAITVPEFFSKRFHEKKPVILTVSALFIIAFFVVYAASCFVTCGKLFSTLFGFSYHSMMIAGAIFILAYTFTGGFLGESAVDFMQAIVMIIALTTIVAVGFAHAGGVAAVVENAKSIPGFFSLSATATPLTDSSGMQIVENGVAKFGEAANYGLLSKISTLSWGLGYFGLPQVLLRFMAIRHPDELTRSRRIASVWVVVSLSAALAIGAIGRNVFATDSALASASSAENVFILLAQSLLPPIAAGVVLAGVLAATISSADSYMLISTSAFAKNIFAQSFALKREVSDRTIMRVSRFSLAAVALLGIAIAWDEHSVIFTIVSFAWAGLGATFGPLMLFSLFWRKTTRAGAVAGVVAGGCAVFAWKLLVRPLGGAFDIYELLPAFAISSIAIVAASLASPAPSAEIEAEFDAACKPQG